MATRGRHTRDDGQREFTGRVRRWNRVWAPSKEPKSKELRFQRWMRTDERPPQLAGPRHAYIVPYKDPAAKPYPLHRMVPPPGPPGLPAMAAPAAGAAGIKRGKSQPALADAHHSGPPAAAAPAPLQPPAAPPPKIKLKFTLGARIDAANAAAGAGGAAPSPAAAAASMGSPPAAPGQVSPLGQSSPFPSGAGQQQQQQAQQGTASMQLDPPPPA